MPNSLFPNSTTYHVAELGLSRIEFIVDPGSSGGLTAAAIGTAVAADIAASGLTAAAIAADILANNQALTTGVLTVNGVAGTTSASLLALSGKTHMASFTLQVNTSASGIFFSDGTRTITLTAGSSLTLAAGDSQSLGSFSVTTAAGDIVELTWQCF